MALTLPDPVVPHDEHATAAIQRNFDAIARAFPLSPPLVRQYGAKISRGSTNVAFSASTFTPVTFTTTVFDATGDMTSVASRLTLPTAGLWIVGGYCRFPTNGTSGAIEVNLRSNGTSYVQPTTFMSSSTQILASPATTLTNATAGDYWELVVWSNCPSPLYEDAELWAARL